MKISLSALCLGATNIPMKMQKRENKTGIRKAGATRFIIFTPPNTIKHSKMVTIMPQTWRSCRLGVAIVAVPVVAELFVKVLFTTVTLSARSCTNNTFKQYVSLNKAKIVYKISRANYHQLFFVCFFNKQYIFIYTEY